jgi:hypothetical protein
VVTINVLIAVASAEVILAASNVRDKIIFIPSL